MLTAAEELTACLMSDNKVDYYSRLSLGKYDTYQWAVGHYSRTAGAEAKGEEEWILTSDRPPVDESVVSSELVIGVIPFPNSLEDPVTLSMSHLNVNSVFM